MIGPRYRILFVDVDGTLVLGDTGVSARVCHALGRCREAGCTIVLCTGRTMYRTRPIAAEVGATGWAIVHHGAVIQHLATGGVLRKTRLESALVGKLISGAADHDLCALCYAADADDQWIHLAGGGRLPENVRERFRAHFVEAGSDGAHLPGPPVVMEAYGPREIVEALAAQWRADAGADVQTYVWESLRARAWGVSAHSACVSKAAGAAEIAAVLGVPREQTMAIGDWLNDLPLMEWAGLGVAMGSGHEELQAHADYVTTGIDDDGVADAIQRYVLC